MAYPGGKGRCYQRIVSMMPPHRVYIETHLGGGAVMRAKRPAEVNIGVELDPAVVARWQSSGPAHLTLVQADAVSFLDGFTFSGDELVYADPPYLPGLRRRQRVYRHDYTSEEHVRLLASLRQLPCAVMISGYASRLYDQALPGWLRVDFPNPGQRGSVMESLWLNFPLPDLLHDHWHLGSTFREREAVQRRREGLLRRIRALDVQERNALFAELAMEHPGGFHAASLWFR